MSRTYKDRHWKIKFNWLSRDEECDRIEYYVPQRVYNPDTGQRENTDEVVVRYSYIQKPGIKPKQKRSKNTEFAWYSATPSWWTNLFMNRPQRRKGRQWERKVLLEELEETDPPGVSRKPHKYYW